MKDIVTGIALVCIGVSGIIGTYRISEIEDHISHPAKLVEVKQDNYTLWKLCPDGKTAAEEISADGTKIIRLPCDDGDINRL